MKLVIPGSLSEFINIIFDKKSTMPLDVHTRSISLLLERAGKEIVDISNKSGYEIKLKPDQSPVTTADLRSEELIADGLKKLFPGIPVISEEKVSISSPDEVLPDIYWILDPIDGTKEFIKGNGEYCISLARIEKGELREGYIYAPASSTLWYAHKGKGAYKLIGGEAVSLPIGNGKEKITILKSRSHSGEPDKRWNKKVSGILPAEEEYQGSAIKFCRIAEGSGDLYIKFGAIKRWDIAAGVLIVEESGGAVNSLLSAGRLMFNTSDLKVEPFLVSSSRIDKETVAKLLSMAGDKRDKRLKTKDERV